MLEDQDDDIADLDLPSALSTPVDQQEDFGNLAVGLRDTLMRFAQRMGRGWSETLGFAGFWRNCHADFGSLSGKSGFRALTGCR